MLPIVVAITGASGAVYAVRLLEVLTGTGHDVELVVSPAAAIVFREELGLHLNLDDLKVEQLLPLSQHADHPLLSGFQSVDSSESTIGQVRTHQHQDFLAGIASGSHLTQGMVVCPCSLGTLSAIAGGQATNLIHRAADVHLKERRKLIVVPRETPLGIIQLENMTRLATAGAVILPAMPGFYHTPAGIADLVDFIVGRICDQLGVPHNLFRRWGSEAEKP